MIQFKRGGTANWRKLEKPLAAGQPGYDKNKHKIKIGDGTTSWSALPYASGLSSDDVLMSEADAKTRKTLDPEDATIITYGTDGPDDKTVGQIYLQHYDAEPEADYIVDWGVNDGWHYQKWSSGIAKCFKTFEFTTAVQTALGDNVFYKNSTAMEQLDYPFIFKEAPSETYSIQSPGGLVWLAAAKNGGNTTTKTAAYTIVSPDKLNNAIYKISLQVEGIWR